MADTERMEAATQVDEQRLRMAILDDLEGRILDVVCAALTPRFSIALAILVILGLVQATIIMGWVSSGLTDLRTAIASQGAAADKTGAQVTALDGVAVRQPQIDALREEMSELTRANRALAGNVSVVTRQQERIDTSVEILSGYVKSIENSVGDDKQWRREMMQEIRGLGAQLRARQ